MKLSGWGRYPVLEARLGAPRDLDALGEHVRAGAAIARGNGRSYGDSAVSPDNTVHMRHFHHMLAFDPTTGQLVAEAGVLLADVIAAFLPRGWFPAVTPGTKFVTLGGMIAADVHGKNHHRDGSFASCVDWIDLMDATGRLHRCSRDENAELFGWTLGGMGLTGIILRAAIRLRPVETGWIRQTTKSAPSLEAAMAALEASDEATYSVAWIDCLGTGAQLGRSLVMLGEHATRQELSGPQAANPFAMGPRRRLSVPVDAPAALLNGLTVRAFNALYYWKGTRGAGTRLVGWDGYFYPLDGILGWNRIYGRRGFVQFQCALPPDTAEAGLRALLRTTSQAGAGSFLAVLKRFGTADGPGQFSFPMPGYTLALDFPVRAGTERLMDRLDAITLEHDGRFYLAKDARMSARTLEQSDPRTAIFRAGRARMGMRPAFASAQSERLDL
ncbi:FAD-binding oxidoreductase [Rhodobaculum claviforme]|uniref:FAD-linked oxidase n=1 Tax=Rhodobaculum claviforme TaxID=1549854 RepID=A0A934WI00_9RHOB|nr:FAD-binding oxidoreductase [Rhodobaculum claviforme]MBK5926326.1 FAD-linked oxidase [Rhodobaculum claviforme]